MSELKATAIRRKLNMLCDFFERTIREKELVYDEGFNQEAALKEIKEIKIEVNTTRSFTMAFVGEYNSGKTTLINILTGQNYKIGTDVSTQTPQEVSWNGMTLIDTPGLGSGLLEHDASTEEWLARADLIVYVLTSEGLNRQAGERFLTMLDRYKRDHELMLVMNQIDREENSLDVYWSELQKVLDPRPLEDYFPTFVSAKYKQMSLQDKYPEEERDDFLQESQFETFIENLNSFVLGRRERAAITTPLTQLEVLIRKIRFRNQYDMENGLIDKQLAIVEQAKRDTRRTFSDYSEKLQGYAKETGGTIFRHLEEGSNDFKEHLETELKNFEGRVEKAIQEELTEDYAGIWDELQRQNTTLEQSPLAKTVFSNIDGTVRLKEILGKISLGYANPASQSFFEEFQAMFHEWEQKCGMNIPEEMKDVMNSRNILSATGKGLSRIDRNMVLKAGHLFGKKFKPWGAIKIAKNFSKAAPVLNVASGLFEVFTLYKEEQKQKEADQKKREFKDQVKNTLDEAVHEACQLSRNAFQPLEEALTITRKVLLQKKSELAKYSTEMANVRQEFEETRRQCLLLYDEIYEIKSDE